MGIANNKPRKEAGECLERAEHWVDFNNGLITNFEVFDHHQPIVSTTRKKYQHSLAHCLTCLTRPAPLLLALFPVLSVL